VGIVLLSLLLIEIGTIQVLEAKREAQREADHKAQQAEFEQREAARRQQERQQELTRSEPAVVPLSKISHECSALNSDITCYLTNFAKTPVVTCMQGLLVQKEAAGVRLYSMPMCSGPIPPLATRAVTGPWSGGRASDICKGGNYLDFGKCNFTVIDYVNKE
jgi:hypothetical protein